MAPNLFNLVTSHRITVVTPRYSSWRTYRIYCLDDFSSYFYFSVLPATLNGATVCEHGSSLSPEA